MIFQVEMILPTFDEHGLSGGFPLPALKNTASELDLLAMRMGISWASLNPASLDVFPGCVCPLLGKGEIFSANYDSQPSGS